MYSQPIRSGDPQPSGGDSIDELGGVAFQPAHIEAALGVLATLPLQARGNPLMQAQALQAYVVEAGLGDDPVVSAALHARITALAKWTAAHDPGRQSDPQAVMTATASVPLKDLSDGIGFDPAAFQELLLFIEELPW